MSHGSESLLPKNHPKDIPSQNTTESYSSETPSPWTGQYMSDNTEARVLYNLRFRQTCVQDEPQSHISNLQATGPRKRGARNGSSRDQDRRSQNWLEKPNMASIGNGRYYTYRSTDHERWPPTMLEIKASYPLPINLLPEDFDHIFRPTMHRSETGLVNQEARFD
ncbi:hypothetical protein LPUS_04439 [Lasallia pustulata]|uniref:Uncharacterized protein n=1 Tax=Lasallia pustulata TaxID=136370 RepID=A0A1W5CWN6_9LECA|nr:hypothetical protein LPUS_04439 [Lasallia pustulata]